MPISSNYSMDITEEKHWTIKIANNMFNSERTRHVDVMLHNACNAVRYDSGWCIVSGVRCFGKYNPQGCNACLEFGYGRGSLFQLNSALQEAARCFVCRAQSNAGRHCLLLLWMKVRVCASIVKNLSLKSRTRTRSTRFTRMYCAEKPAFTARLRYTLYAVPQIRAL